MGWKGGLTRFSCVYVCVCDTESFNYHRQAKLTGARVVELLGPSQQEGQEEGGGNDDDNDDDSALYLAPGACLSLAVHG